MEGASKINGFNLLREMDVHGIYIYIYKWDGRGSWEERKEKHKGKWKRKAVGGSALLREHFRRIFGWLFGQLNVIHSAWNFEEILYSMRGTILRCPILVSTVRFFKFKVGWLNSKTLIKYFFSSPFKLSRKSHFIYIYYNIIKTNPKIPHTKLSLNKLKPLILNSPSKL